MAKKIIKIKILYKTMVKILLFIFSIQPLLDCFKITLLTLSLGKITESLSYLALIIGFAHYLSLGLKEIFKETNKEIHA